MAQTRATHARSNCTNAHLCGFVSENIWFNFPYYGTHSNLCSALLLLKSLQLWQVGWLPLHAVTTVWLLLHAVTTCPMAGPNTIYNICMQIMYNYGLFTPIQLPLIHKTPRPHMHSCPQLRLVEMLALHAQELCAIQANCALLLVYACGILCWFAVVKCNWLLLSVFHNFIWWIGNLLKLAGSCMKN